MSTDVIEILVMLLTGLIAGVLNTVAGGGSLVSLPVLIFWGLPGLEANATNRIAIVGQNIFAVAGFKSKKVTLPKPYIYQLAIVSLFGGVLGTVIALYFPDHSFNRLLSVVMVLVALTIVKKPKYHLTGEVDESKRKLTLGIIGFFFLGVYGGFLQAGIGFLVVALLSNLHGYSLVRSNYMKVFNALIYTGIATLIFAYSGVINWKLGIIMAIGQGVGGWFASRWQVNKGDRWIRPILVATVLALAIKLWFF